MYVCMYGMYVRVYVSVGGCGKRKYLDGTDNPPVAIKLADVKNKKS